MVRNVVWTNGSTKVVKYDLVDGKYKYYIVDEEDSISLYEWDGIGEGMLDMCKAVIADAEKESEEQ